jgi:DNA mismatch repair protein MutS2
MIIDKTLKTLEYDKILNLMLPFTSSETGKRRILETVPQTTYEAALNELNLTVEADKVLYQHGINVSFTFDEITDQAARSKKLSVLTMGDLLRIARLLKTARIVYSGIDDINDSSLEMLKQMSSGIYISFTLEKDIFRSILSENEMSDNASTTLKSIRQSINRCNDKIRDKLNSYVTSSSTAKYLQDNIVTIRNDRYVIPVKSEHRGQISGLIHDQSASGSTVYVEPMMVVELNNELKILIAEEEKEIYRILKEFTTRVSVVADSILADQEILTEMDLIFARAMFGKSIKGTCPTLNSHGYIDIKRGRHPLINPDVVVPVTVRLGDKYRILMITGPNTGGKTVTLKLTGLLTLMGLSGIFIPAEEGSTISVFENVWCDIGDEQSIEQSLSTFSSHMRNIISITEQVNSNTLVLLDELGAGTDPQEGAALAMAVTSHIIESGAYGVITTHYPELKEYALITDAIENASMDFDPDSFKPTYNLVIGIPGASNAIQIASRLGLNKQITTRAVELLSEDKIKLEKVLVQAEEARRRADNSLSELEKKHRDFDGDILKLERDKEKLLEEKEKIRTNAQRETKRLVNAALEEVNEIVAELKDMLEQDGNIDIFKAHKLRKRLESISVDSEEKTEKSDEIEEIAGDITVGDRVYLKNMNNYAEVAGINKKGEYEVKMGALSLSVKPDDVIKVKQNKPKQAEVHVVRPYNTGAVKPEVNLIGMTTEEALFALDLFINDAVTGGLGEVRVVHGKGTGTLRKAVQDYLNKSPIIKEFRKGIYGEGENGVTIVKLK